MKTDTELLTAHTGSGDENAFRELVTRYTPLVYRMCRRMAHNSQDAEDCTQAVFVILARKAKRLRHGERLAAWLCRVARHVALRAIESRSTRSRHEEAAAMENPQVQEPVSSSGTPEVLDALYTALSGQTERQCALPVDSNGVLEGGHPIAYKTPNGGTGYYSVTINFDLESCVVTK